MHKPNNMHVDSQEYILCYTNQNTLCKLYSLIIHQVTDEAEPVHKLLLHHQIHPLPTTQRDVKRVNPSCQIEESTPNNTYGFQVSFQNLQEVKAICEVIYKL